MLNPNRFGSPQSLEVVFSTMIQSRGYHFQIMHPRSEDLDFPSGLWRKAARREEEIGREAEGCEGYNKLSQPLTLLHSLLAYNHFSLVVPLAMPFLERLDVLGFTGQAEKERLEHELKSKMLGGSIFKSCQYSLVPCLLLLGTKNRNGFCRYVYSSTSCSIDMFQWFG